MRDRRAHQRQIKAATPPPIRVVEQSIAAPRYVNSTGREVRLGKVQREQLEMCAQAHQRRAVRNPTMVRLVEHGFVTNEQHYSARTGLPTTDRLHRITLEGERYLIVGRDRS